MILDQEILGQLTKFKFHMHEFAKARLTIIKFVLDQKGSVTMIEFVGGLKRRKTTKETADHRISVVYFCVSSIFTELAELGPLCRKPVCRILQTGPRWSIL